MASRPDGCWCALNAINLVDRWVDAQQVYDQIPGVSAAVVHDQEILWSAGQDPVGSVRDPVGPRIYEIGLRNCPIS